MRLGKASAYAVFATVHIAEQNSGAPIQGRDIAEACNIPPGHLLKILQQLVRSRILNSERGPSGGFSLGRTANKITLLDIVEAIEGRIDGELVVPNDIANMSRAKKGVEAACTEVAKHTRSVLKNMSITGLME